MERRLDADEAALWARVMANVRPLRPQPTLPVAPPPTPTRERPPQRAIVARSTPAPPRQGTRTSTVHGTTLDASWDRKLARGLAQPDSVVDLHGFGLQAAHAALDAGLERAIARRDRVLLLVTGRPPRPESERPHARGAIRAAVGDWIAASRHAGSVAAVRMAHPRHGGAGALYIVLRRARGVVPES